MYCVGLTGNIASGKSTVASYFETLGVEIISADKIAKELTTREQPALYHIINHFGESVLTPNGDLNRRYLRHVIFKNTQERLWLEKLLHPLIQKEIQQTIHNIKSPYCIIEIPLLFDKSNYPYLNQVLVVQAELEEQIARIITRDNCSRDDALAILATQADNNQRLEWADDVLINKGSLTALHEKVNALHSKYTHLASKASGNGTCST